jgi:hypothetical protein
MSNLWDDDQNEEFRDRPDETQLDGSGQYLQAPPVRTQTHNAQPRPAPVYRPPNVPAEPEPTFVEEEIDLDSLHLDEQDDFTEILNDANLRIEQGRLYQMVMNHELFEGMDVDPRAVTNVQREIRKFARESMEVMLGMRSKTPTNVSTSSPFNDLEVDILKKLASKATNGATETAEANQVASVLKEAPKRKTLNPIGQKAVSGSIRQYPAKLPSKASTPLKRTKLDLTIDQICAEEGIPREALEENYRPLGKPANELSEEEVMKRAKETAKRLSSRTRVDSASKLPMATLQQEEMLALQRAQQVAAGPGMSAILAKIQNMPTKK